MYASYDQWLKEIGKSNQGKTIKVPCRYCDGEGVSKCNHCGANSPCQECDSYGYNWAPFGARSLDLYSPEMYCTDLLKAFYLATPGKWHLLTVDFWNFIQDENNRRNRVARMMRWSSKKTGEWDKFSAEMPETKVPGYA